MYLFAVLLWSRCGLALLRCMLNSVARKMWVCVCGGRAVVVGGNLSYFCLLPANLRGGRVANLESELEELRNYNDAYENEVLNSVDLEEIKQKAIGKLGMKYPDAEHVQEYDANSKGYMRQYKIVGEEE